MARRARNDKTGPVPSVPARYRVQVLDRSFRILDALAAADRDLSPAELATELRLHKSTIHRLLVVLETQQFIRKTVNGKYGLGMKLVEMGSRAKERLDLGEHAIPFLQRLVNATGESAHISVLSGNEMVSMAYVGGHWTLSTPSAVGRRTQVHCTSVGKAFIAFLPEPALSHLMGRLIMTRRTRRTIVTATALRGELARIRRRGFAVDDEEVEAGLRCIGAPVRNHTGAVVAAISIAGPVFRLPKARTSELARAVTKAAADLSADLGFGKSESRAGRAAVS